MKAIYIRRLDGEIQEFPEDSLQTPPAFYRSGMCKIIAKDTVYIVHASNVEIIADEEDEVIGYVS